MMKTLLILGVIALTGCATPTTGVVPRGNDVFTVTRQGGSAWVTTESLKAAALQEAGAFCEKNGRRLNLIHSKDIPAGPLGRWPESEVVFSCLPV